MKRFVSALSFMLLIPCAASAQEHAAVTESAAAVQPSSETSAAPNEAQQNAVPDAAKTAAAPTAKKCTKDTECLMTELCSNGVCTDACASNPCHEGGHCLARPTHTFLCVECIEDKDCPEANICTEGFWCGTCAEGDACRCAEGFESDGYGKCRRIMPSAEDWNAECAKVCGEGYKYGRMGDNFGGNERICVTYPKPYGKEFTTGWDTTAVHEPYTCQTAVQDEPPYEYWDAGCYQACGGGYIYTENGEKFGGNERICSSYAKPCGDFCTDAWQLTGENEPFTCRTAVQHEPTEKEWRDGCAKYCGEGFEFSRIGENYDGNEHICTKFPKPCGEACTTSWEIVYAADTYTCETAIQEEEQPAETSAAADDPDAGCRKYCGEQFHYSRPGAKYDGNERVCLWYPKPCGYNCTESWDIQYANNPYTCQTAIQRDDTPQIEEAPQYEAEPAAQESPAAAGVGAEDPEAGCKKYCGPGFHYGRSGAKYGGNERVCVWYPKSCGYNCTDSWDIQYANNPYTCQTAIQH